jgi:hypothetical protein
VKPARETVVTGIPDRPPPAIPKVPGATSEQVVPDWWQRAMRDRQGLQTALVMSEILGPPLALRQHDWP